MTKNLELTPQHGIAARSLGVSIVLLLLGPLMAGCLQGERPGLGPFDVSSVPGPVTVMPTLLVKAPYGEFDEEESFDGSLAIQWHDGKAWILQEPSRGFFYGELLAVESDGSLRVHDARPDGFYPGGGAWGDGLGIHVRSLPPEEANGFNAAISTFDLDSMKWTSRDIQAPVLPPQWWNNNAEIQDGQAFLVIGSIWDEEAGERSQIWRLDPNSGTVSLFAKLPVPVYAPATVIHDDWLYVMGGKRIGEGAPLTAPSYDQFTEWTDLVQRVSLKTGAAQKVGFLPYPNAGQAAASDGHAIYLFGGIQGGDRIVRYDPASKTSVAMEGRLPAPRVESDATWTGSHFLVAGGRGPMWWNDIIQYTPSIDAPDGDFDLMMGFRPTNRQMEEPTVAASAWDDGFTVEGSYDYPHTIIRYDSSGKREASPLSDVCCQIYGWEEGNPVCLVPPCLIHDDAQGNLLRRFGQLPVEQKIAGPLPFAGEYDFNYKVGEGQFVSWITDYESEKDQVTSVDLATGNLLTQEFPYYSVGNVVPASDQLLFLSHWNPSHWIGSVDSPMRLGVQHANQEWSNVSLLPPTESWGGKQTLWDEGRLVWAGGGTPTCTSCSGLLVWDERQGFLGFLPGPLTKVLTDNAGSLGWGPISKGEGGYGFYGVPWALWNAKGNPAWWYSINEPPVPKVTWRQEAGGIHLAAEESTDPEAGILRYAWAIAEYDPWAAGEDAFAFGGASFLWPSGGRETYAVHLFASDPAGGLSVRSLVLEPDVNGTYHEAPLRHLDHGEINNAYYEMHYG